MRLAFAIALAASLLGLSTPLLATSGATSGSDRSVVRFAQVAALEGPAGALGQGLRLGLLAAFEEANRAGGVNGRKIRMDSFDDGYEPTRSAAEVEKMLADDRYLALVGQVGTPTAKATLPVAAAAGMPMIGPLTGADFLRAPWVSNVANIRASYDTETEAWIAYLVDALGKDRIAVLYQDDGFGQVGLEGVRRALKKRGLTPVAEGNYTRNTLAVKVALLNIRKANPDAVVMVAAYKPVAEFVRVGRKLGFTPQLVNISFVGSRALSEELGPAGEGIIVSQVVPFPGDTSLPVVAEYQAALKAVDAEAAPEFVSLEGYLAGRVALKALEKAGPFPTRAKMLAALDQLGDLDLGGLHLVFGPGDNQGLDQVFLTRISADGAFEPVEIPAPAPASPDEPAPEPAPEPKS
ncbi:ABC transporter substrate-binding protein [Rhodovulum sp. BSW8]|uniref:Amino acid/amide ABC transporter substrate-binding protein (HAAT family) n=1 Tax=Rhodovulum visakhapatnamense TaxID=364297 RepID=A0A4R8FSD1_9RHOB|nr:MULTISPECIES: ABC transporter substrate-binding protein [Rhodovulum]RBO52007.1 ABC transporter substrate-binding protein [Rhodovulum sp. BSW8]TDX29315.1 amino acid/amide ABC transporter substrate-binding protein (HAAT family) [Rhodovulum visakhapatnamense]